MNHILVVEDNEDIAFGLRRTLEFEGFEVEVATDGEAGLRYVKRGDVSLVLLDLMLPGMSGFEMLRAVRSEGLNVPVLILTARGDESDVVMGFQSGADDYVTKPFSTLELLARIRALLRRGNGAPKGAPRLPSRLRFGKLEIDTSARTVTRNGEEVQLSPKEFDLLIALFQRKGDIASRGELLEEVWQYANSAVMTRTVDIHIAELRRKLEENPARPRHIITVRKAGYRLVV